MNPDHAVDHDDDMEVQIDHVIIDMGDGATDDEVLAREITASILTALGRLDLEG